MQSVQGDIVSVSDPESAYAELQSNPAAVLIDVRTQAEWAFVGLPDISATGKPLITLEWQAYPAMAVDPAFAEKLDALLGDLPGPAPEHLLFLCRSGARSLSAAHAYATGPGAARKTSCTNVAEGFEGDLDAEGHRGRVNGWKARGLPWRQR